MNFEKKFKLAESYNQNKKFIYFDDEFKKCFEFQKDYSFSDFDSMKLVEGNQLQFFKNGRNPKPLTITIFDDLSYVKLRNTLKYNEIFDEYDNS